MNNQFLKKDTRKQIVIMSVLAAIVAVALIMTAFLISGGTDVPKSLILCVMALAALFILSIFNGIIQIKVFNDYKSQTKSLCAEGIFNICLTILVFISFFLFARLQFAAIIDNPENLKSVDLRYFIGIFVAAFAFWKVFAIVNAVKQKRNNLWIEIIICALWLILALDIFLSIPALTAETIKKYSDVIGWIGSITSLLLIGSMTLFNLYSYIFKEPTYLVTEEGLAQLEKDNADRAARMNRIAALQGTMMAQAPVAPQPQAVPEQKEEKKESVEDKLAKLEELKSKGLITEEEYAEKRKKIIDSL